MHPAVLVLGDTVVSIWIIIALLLSDYTVQANVLCPSGFEFLAYEGNSIDLPSSFGKAYVTFGRPGFYSLSVISVTDTDLTNTFQCAPTNLGKVTNLLEESDTMEMGKKGGFFKHSKPKLVSMDEKKSVCCICSLRNAEDARMLLFPTQYSTKLNEIGSGPDRWKTESDSVPEGISWIEYKPYNKKITSVSYDILALSALPSSTCKPMLADLTIGSKKSVCQSKTLGLDTGTWGQLTREGETHHVYAWSGRECYPSLALCNTKNQMGLTVFVFTYTYADKSTIRQQTQFVKAAYSMTGIYDVTALFADLVKPFTAGSKYRVTYMPMYKFWKMVDKPLPPDAQTKANVEWRL
eukprot:154990_1